MKDRLLLTGLLMVLVGCNQSPTPSGSETPISSPSSAASTSAPVSPSSSPTASNPVEASPSSSPIPSEPMQASPSLGKTTAQPLSPPASTAFTISPQGIGPAKVGMTYAQLKKQLAGKAEFKVKSPFIVDFDAIAVSQGGKEQFYILYPTGVPLAESDVIEALVTDNPNYRTAQGVGPGTAIEQAEAVYGKASLSYNSLNESREYVQFTNQPSKDIAFRTKAPASQPFAGIYPASKAELKKTSKFQKAASIGLVEVYCRQNCPLPAP
ncbi:hypothetical protein [Allocoleopsis sp.]|uniref:hypothetical protein n=1 Tax=Allocoleopsis sp. TaxID=3088169 RepID=UPI002FD25144